jgi:hypothetical protein
MVEAVRRHHEADLAERIELRAQRRIEPHR